MGNAATFRARRAAPWAATPGAFLPFLLIAVLCLSACGPARALLAACRSTEGFVPLADDPRIRCEPGAEPLAQAVAPLLGPAVAAVEEGHGAPFAAPVGVYVCASEASFTRFTGSKGKGAVTRELFLSPALLQEPEFLPLYLAHELSHLHILQRIGVADVLKLPVWFKEGLATLVSHGGGAQDVSDAEALAAMRAGRSFRPDAGGTVLGGLFFPQYAATFHLENQMFYRQAMLFTQFLRNEDGPAFRALLSDIESHRPFPDAFLAAYKSPLPEVWQRFQRKIRTQAALGRSVEKFQEEG
ncbi:MAG TPA: hypothetical protein PKD41_10205 [Solidesulfovibrio sp.]|nr:hypothetical protein [Desulfovibrio sp.]HML61257.1 hypothetical protein [Solidesulfovibrio sp.]